LQLVRFEIPIIIIITEKGIEAKQTLALSFLYRDLGSLRYCRLQTFQKPYPIIVHQKNARRNGRHGIRRAVTQKISEDDPDWYSSELKLRRKEGQRLAEVAVR